MMKFATVLLASLLLVVGAQALPKAVVGAQDLSEAVVVGAQDLPEEEQRELHIVRARMFRTRGRRGRGRSSKSSYSNDDDYIPRCTSNSRRLGSKTSTSSRSYYKTKKTCKEACLARCPDAGKGTGGARCQQKCRKKWDARAASASSKSKYTPKSKYKYSTKSPKSYTPSDD